MNSPLLAWFNAGSTTRKIDRIRILEQRRPLHREQWLSQMYGLHVLDHPVRAEPARQEPETVSEQASSGRDAWPL